MFGVMPIALGLTSLSSGMPPGYADDRSIWMLNLTRSSARADGWPALEASELLTLRRRADDWTSFAVTPGVTGHLQVFVLDIPILQALFGTAPKCFGDLGRGSPRPLTATHAIIVGSSDAGGAIHERGQGNPVRIR